MLYGPLASTQALASWVLLGLKWFSRLFCTVCSVVALRRQGRVRMAARLQATIMDYSEFRMMNAKSLCYKNHFAGPHQIKEKAFTVSY
eukprot:3909241-Amphidinium_carterae.1